MRRPARPGLGPGQPLLFSGSFFLLLLFKYFAPAIELIRQPKTRGRGGSRGQTSLKDFGVNPANGKAVKLLSGRYGAYVTDGEVNATVPRGSDPMQLSNEQAYELLAARAQQIADAGGPEAAKKAAKSRRTTAKKSARKRSDAVEV